MISDMFLNNYLDIIKDDYVARTSSRTLTELECKVIHDMNAKFCSSVRYEIGKKYVKVITGTCVHSFIVNVDNDKQFKKGDVLKAASWNAPARNFPRGNVLSSDTLCNITWTGAN